MDKALAVKVEQKEMIITMEDIKKYIAPKATDKELFMFMGISKSYGLNPFKREIHFVKYGDNPASIIVGYEQYLKRAERTGQLDGWKCWMEDMGKETEKALIEIKRKDQSTPIKWEVFRNEFDKKQSTWKSMPTFMLKKVAIAQGFRLAFPDELGGMPYIPEEMPVDKGCSVKSEELPTDTIDITPKEGKPAHEDAPESTQSPVDDAVVMPEVERPDYMKLKAKTGDLGAALRCPDLPKGKNVRPKSDCNICEKTKDCPAWE